MDFVNSLLADSIKSLRSPGFIKLSQAWTRR
ncbi:hypothetical protein COMA1_20710 [Candidatus Nitrospira nitrosa]|uniref:Uncharacterized protein n=1 Tax=Candidatus Nitrospira nitrosa TaxID=1742972 RepID=A0A0S4LFE3_9BACT|nr:hypothetical protein COMA1_20710 [Candidatus Nitrospira nitrosa]